MGFVYLVYLWKIQMFFLKVFQIRVSFTYDIEHLVLVAMAKASPLQTVAEAAVFFGWMVRWWLAFLPWIRKPSPLNAHFLVNHDSGRVGVVGIKTISWKVLSWWYRVAFSELHPKRKIGRESPEKLPRKSSDLFVIQLSLLKSKKTTSWGGLMVFLLILRY